MKKDDSVLRLFFDHPTKQWHFEDILKEAKISRPQAAHWLRQFIKEGIIKRIKTAGAMPYYVSDYENPNYQTKKRIYLLNELENKGLLSHLSTLAHAKTVILFGSMSRWDWNKDSDIDIFIYGNDAGFDRHAYRSKLKRQIETLTCKNKSELKKIKPSLLRNIAEGYIIKGGLDFLEVRHA